MNHTPNPLLIGPAPTAAPRRPAQRACPPPRTTEPACLAGLRCQIEPHFLFNTLATVRGLAHVEPVRGARLLAHLVDYLRSALSAGPDASHTLGREIDLASAYLGVMALRMAGRLQTHFEVADDLRLLPFPPLTIATLVENAVKHGIAPARGGGAIAVSVSREGGALQAVVADTGVGFAGTCTGGSGIGLANIRARLHALYGGAGTLSLEGNQPCGVRATLRLPCVSPGAAA